jgi:hypothetical protein
LIHVVDDDVISWIDLQLADDLALYISRQMSDIMMVREVYEIGDACVDV